MHYAMRISNPDAEPSTAGYEFQEGMVRRRLGQVLGLLCDSIALELYFLDIKITDLVFVVVEDSNRVRVVIDRDIKTSNLQRFVNEYHSLQPSHLRALFGLGFVRREYRPTEDPLLSSVGSDASTWIQIYNSPESRPPNERR